METHNSFSYSNCNRENILGAYRGDYYAAVMTVGERISERLNALGMSQAELARRVGISQPTVNQLVNGDSVGSKHLHVTPPHSTGRREGEEK
jgi:DNA-binding CsgD family transcriptional regulator